MANYADEASIKLVYGVLNINKWADLDNDADATKIANRIDWACTAATDYVNSRLTLGKYTIPFTSVPTMIELITSMLAGLMLFDGRLAVSSEPKFDQVARQRKDLNRYIRQIVSGQLKLVSPLDGEPLDQTCINYPTPVDSTVDGDEVDDTNCCPSCNQKLSNCYCFN